MAEAFGIAAGAVGIAAAFTACVDCFEYVQFGRHFGRDYQTDLLALNCSRVRLTRWGQAVDILNDPKLGRPDATAPEIRTVKDTLYQILVLFADSAKISQQYKLGATAGEDLSVFSIDSMDSAIVALSNNMRELAIKRQKSSSILKITQWALYRRSEFKSLIEGISSLIDSIEKIFPAPQAQVTLVRQEATELHDQGTLELVQSAAEGVDSLLQNAAKEVLSGHRYLNVLVKGKAQAGDAVSSDWHGRALGALGASHIYDGVVVDNDGKALIGNKYGGKDFWDD
ncbi:MAG: hypothetical protein Q9179_007816 [Wetmoreana sp. 5 TL-2023]